MSQLKEICEATDFLRGSFSRNVDPDLNNIANLILLNSLMIPLLATIVAESSEVIGAIP